MVQIPVSSDAIATDTYSAQQKIAPDVAFRRIGIVKLVFVGRTGARSP